MLSRNKCVIKIDISLFLAVQTLSGSVNSIVCDRNEFNTKKTTLQGLWFHVPSLNRTNGISIYLINKVAPKQKYQRRKRNKSESKTFMFHGGKTARTRTQSWRAAVHCRVRLKRRERPKAQWQPVGPWVPSHGPRSPRVAPRGSRRPRIFLGCSLTGPAVFLFLYFIFSFFTKIYFRFRNLQEYTPTARLPGGRNLAARQRGGRGFCEKNFAEKIARRSLGAGRSAPGRPAPQAARQRGGRPWPPGCRATGRNFCNLSLFAK